MSEHDRWRLKHMTQVRAREVQLQGHSHSGGGEGGEEERQRRRRNGPFTRLSGWLMCGGERVRDRASWREARVLPAVSSGGGGGGDRGHERRVKMKDNGAEATYAVVSDIR